MSRRSTLKHTVAATLAVAAVVAAPAGARPLDRIDRFDNPMPTPHQDLRGEHATDPAPPGTEKFMPGQPTWPSHPRPFHVPTVEAAQPATTSSDGGDDTVWLILGIGLAAGGIVAGSAAGVRRHVRARRVAV
jgi:hypothetical protein